MIGQLSDIVGVMDMDTEHKLLCVATAYAAGTGVSLATVGRHAARDDKLFKKLANRRSLTVAKYDIAMRWLSANWPENVQWPEFVERPTARVEYLKGNKPPRRNRIKTVDQGEAA